VATSKMAQLDNKHELVDNKDVKSLIVDAKELPSDKVYNKLLSFFTHVTADDLPKMEHSARNDYVQILTGGYYLIHTCVLPYTIEDFSARYSHIYNKVPCEGLKHSFKHDKQMFPQKYWRATRFDCCNCDLKFEYTMYTDA
jgi:hypothetical protein